MGRAVYARNASKCVISATRDDRELLRRIRLFDSVKYRGPFVIVEHPDGSRTPEFGLQSIAEVFAYYGIARDSV